MPEFLDQLQRRVILPSLPSRIVSLVPSQTELLFRLGLEDQVVGITKFCTHPDAWYRTKTRVGGTKTVDPEKVAALRPDLIIAGKEENIKEQVEGLAEHFPVWISDVSNYEEALSMIESVGAITGRVDRSQELIRSIQREMDSLQQQRATTTGKFKKRVAYLIWNDPFMAAGGDTYISDMLAKAGFENIYAEQTRYPIVTLKDLEAHHCELLLLSSEPYPFTEVHAASLSEELPNTNVVVVDGVPFSWYGGQLEGAPAYFLQLHRQLQRMA